MNLDQTQEINVKDTLSEQRKQLAKAQAEKAKSVSENHASSPKPSGNKPRNTGKKRKMSKKQLEKMKRKKRLKMIRLGVIGVILLFILVFFVKSCGKKNAADVTDGTQGTADVIVPDTVPAQKLKDEDFVFPITADRQTIGTSDIKEEIADYEGYRFRYPKVDNSVVSAAMESRVDDIILIFKSEVKSCRTDGKVRMLMVGDYAISQTTGKYISVLYDYSKTLSLDSLSGRKIETYTYDLTTGQEVTLASTLTGSYLKFFAEKLQEYADTLDGEQRSSNIVAEEKAFRYYMWSDEGLTLYFAPDTLIEGNMDVLSFTIPMAELAPYMAQ